MKFKSILFTILYTCISNTYIFGSGIPTGLLNPSSNQAERWVDSVMNTLTLRERVAQLFMVAAFSNRDQAHVDEILSLVRDESIGGLCFFQGGPVRQAQLTNFYQKNAKVPLLISMDAEWGLGMRLDSSISYPRQMMLGAADDTRLVYQMGADIARQLKRLGVHVNFAPVVDVNNNPINPVINTRAFGEDRESVTQKGLAYMLGLQDNGIIACAKHFPGHGDTDADSHYDLPLLTHNRQRLDSIELYPFTRLIQSGVASVMVAHIEIPNLEPKPKLASSLSGNVVNNLLVNELGFNGLIFTDALNMKGVSNFFKPQELNFLALKAGNDVILYPSEVKQSINRIVSEIKAGNFPEEEINRRCRKVLEAKYKVGLNNYKAVSTKNLIHDINKPNSELLIRQITEQGITVIKNQNVIPLQRLDKLSIAYLEIGSGRDFKNQISLYGPVNAFSIENDTTQENLMRIEKELCTYNTVIIGYHSINSRPRRDFGVAKPVADLISRVNSKSNTILCIFGGPYALSKIQNPLSFNGLVVSYDNAPITQNLTAQLIFGGIDVSGRLPVSVSNEITIGAGENAGEKIRLKYSIPEELNINSSILYKIDSIALDAISKEAAPGMQILAVKDGIVFYSKSFGNYTYTNPDLVVNENSIYDVASLTKIIATVPSIMDLYSRDLIDLKGKIGKYISLPDSSKYKNLVINDILLHQAGLTPWIPFYLRTLTPLFPSQKLIGNSISSTHAYQLGLNRFLNKNALPANKYYSNAYSYQYPIKVAHELYSVEGIKDSIINWILKTPLEKPGKYVYSDLGFILFHRIIGNVTQQPNTDYLTNTFYKGLGMNFTTYNPLEKFDRNRIVPTEYDLLFRKQLIWGYVHDPAAAMVGGIAGHAGLFSTANDLAKMLQMYLNGGKYGGIDFLPQSTIELFTSCVNCKNGIRRGLGFDKPEPDPKKQTPVSKKASSLSYGHTGFTGTIAWVDPAYNLVYVFLSNRIYPDAENRKMVNLEVRTKIQDVLYEAVSSSEQ